ncbi:MAG: hypothetical protein ACYDEX_14605, partial [Mobilitalea sp.]
ASYFVIPAPPLVIPTPATIHPATSLVIPAPTTVIPAPTTVIPAEAGIHAHRRLTCIQQIQKPVDLLQVVRIFFPSAKLDIAPEKKPQSFWIVIFLYQEQRPEIDGKTLEELNEGDPWEFLPEGQRPQNRTVEGIVGVVTGKSFLFDVSLKKMKRFNIIRYHGDGLLKNITIYCVEVSKMNSHESDNFQKNKSQHGAYEYIGNVVMKTPDTNVI